MIVTADREVVIVIAIDQTAAVIPTTTNVSSDKDAMCFCVIVKDTVCVWYMFPNAMGISIIRRLATTL